jgi:magnesium chelatase family protein
MDMESEEIKKYCQIDQAGVEFLKTPMNRLGFSARAHDRILKVSRTIADLSGSSDRRTEHLSKAIQYRSLDRVFLFYTREYKSLVRMTMAKDMGLF